MNKKRQQEVVWWLIGAVLLIVVIVAMLSGCATTPIIPCASTPVEVPTTTIRYVPIDQQLTQTIPDPGPQLVPGITVSGALQSAANRGNALARANQRLVCIATIQARDVAVAAPSDCGAALGVPLKPSPP